MRRLIVTVVVAWSVGLGMSAAAAWGYALLDAWHGFGDNFQIGYVVGYLDAIALSKRHDARAWVPSVNKPNYEHWRALVNEFYADPANAKRPLPDAMSAAGKTIQDEILADLAERRKRARSAPSPVPTSSAGDAARHD